MNRKHVKPDMDSGLGSDEDRRGRTKEQKQLHNQQLLSGCFIDAASLSDDAEVVDQRKNDERRQGALLFQSSVPHFSMLQMSNPSDMRSFSCSSGNLTNYPESSTPYNSIVQLDLEEPETARKTPLGFYVDLKDVAEIPKTPPSSTTTKNIFSMVIDFEGPKKDKPTKLSSSFISHKKNKLLNKSNLTAKGISSLSSSVSSISSQSVAGTSRQSEELELRDLGSCGVISASLVKNISLSSKSSSSSENIVMEKSNDAIEQESVKDFIYGFVDEGHIDLDNNLERTEDDNNGKADINGTSDNGFEEITGNNEEHPVEEIKSNKAQAAACPQFVKLSDLECQKPRVETHFTPRMSRSIPESSWVESPLLMSHSVGYRSAPHPLEAETSETNSDSDSAVQSFSSQPKKLVRKLGSDLLRMFLEEIGPDVTVEVDGHKLKAHKCILASRCQYFAALLSGNWLEKTGNVISLKGFSYESVYFALCHIYSGAAHVPDSISLVELSSLADMLGLEGLKEVVEHALKQRHCHNFHKPCAGCCTGVLEVLPLSAAYGLDELYQKCLQWITQHFVRVWPSRAFASLPRELREKCYQQHVVHMNADKVLSTILACDKILATLPSMRWAEPVTQLVLQLTDACHLYHRQHFAAVLGSHYVIGLDSGLGFGVCQIEDQMITAAKNLGVEQACRSYSRCCKMLDQNWSRPFADLLNKVKLQLEQCLVGQADRLIRSNAWLRLDTALRSRIKELTPSSEPTSRLPRATPLRIKRSPSSTRANIHSPTVASSNSSRNSSPSIVQPGGRLHTSNGSPSLRRSLLLAAKAPQVPPSPTAHRRSTLTQPTAASAAKSAPSKNANGKPVPRNVPPKPLAKPPALNPPHKPAPSKRSAAVSRNPSVGKKGTPAVLARRPDSRASSPFKSDSRTSSPRKLDSRVTSPIKGNVRSPSPLKDSKASSPRTAITPRKNGSPRTAKACNGEVKICNSRPKTCNSETRSRAAEAKPTPPPMMQRSSTFLKEEPTVMGKIM